MPLVVRELDREQETAWDSYVFSMPQGTFFHLANWRHVIERAFRHRAHYLFVEQDGAIAGILPLVHVKSLLFGNRLVSVPFCVYGGPIASDCASGQALIEHAIGLMDGLSVDLVEFRMRDPGAIEWVTRSDLYATFRKPITGDPERDLKAIPRKQRAVVRKGVENGLRSCVDRDPDRFHRLYGESMRNLGTPVFSRHYLRLIIDLFSRDSEILTVVDDDKPISAVLSFFFRDEVLPYYGGGKPLARQRAAYDFMYWEVMRRAAIQRDARVFDFGRSKFGTGSFAFKKNWGFTAQPLHYRYWLRAGHAIPDHHPLNPRYRLMIQAWKRLPLPAANLIGPSILRGIG